MIFLKYIAHRGLRNAQFKENTLEAFINALKSRRMAGFEFDIRETKDHEFIVNHNAFIKDDLIKFKTLKELQQKHHILTLKEVLKLETNKIFLVEIKDSSIDYDKFIKIINKFKKQKIYIMSFHNKVIYKLKEYKVPAKLGILNYVLNSEEEYNYDFICLLNNLTTPKLIDYFNKKNIEIFMYGVINENKDLIFENTYYIVNQEPIKVLSN